MLYYFLFFLFSYLFFTSFFFFFFNDTATTEIYTLSLHDALPIYRGGRRAARRRTDHGGEPGDRAAARRGHVAAGHVYHRDRKSTRLNSSHSQISYAVFCLKKKKKKRISTEQGNRTMINDA